MQASVDNQTRQVRQCGAALGDLDGCVIEDITDATLAAIVAALPDHGWGVSLSEDHQTVTPLEPHAHWLAEQQARADAVTQRAADLALLAASADPVHQALARLHGVTATAGE